MPFCVERFSRVTPACSWSHKAEGLQELRKPQGESFTCEPLELYSNCFSFSKNSHNGPKCCICHKRYGDLKSLTHHEKAQHPPPYKCRFCGSMFSLLKLYKIHLNFHLKQQRRNDRSVPDRKTHHNNKQWNRSAAYANTYRPPVQTSNQGLFMHLNYPSQQLDYVTQQRALLRCKYCHKQFEKVSSLKKHQMLHESTEGRSSLQQDVDQKRSMSRSSTEFSSHISQSSGNKPGTLTLTPSLLSNLNKLANLNTKDTRDGKKPAILININTNESSTAKESSPTKSLEMPVGGSGSGLMISSVSSLENNFYDKNKSTVMIQNGKKAISLADLQCPICKKIVSQPFSLKIHLRTHTMER